MVWLLGDHGLRLSGKQHVMFRSDGPLVRGAPIDLRKHLFNVGSRKRV